MKYRTTAKAIRNSASNPISIGYCSAYYLLYGKDANAYTCGVYGWNFDVYEIGNYTICTGYRGMVGKGANHTLLREYNSKAMAIVNDWNIPYDTKCEKCDALLMEYLRKEFGEE